MSASPDPTTGDPLTAWVLTDGKAGDEGPCLGIAAALGARVERRVVRPRAPWVWVLPYGPIDPAEAAGRPGSPIAPPWPDLVLACGRRAVAYARAVKRAAGKRTLVVVLRDPRTRRHGADLLWVATHDAPRGPDVIVTDTTPHRIGADLLARLRADPPAWAADLPAPRVAVVIGGGDGLDGLPEKLAALAPAAGSFLVTPSRRTPPGLLAAVRSAVAGRPGFVWDGTGDNPYPAFLALADQVVVTGDSFNMVSEALATGRPVLVHEPTRPRRKLHGFLNGLYRAGLARPFQGRLEDYKYAPVDSTPVIAAAIAHRLPADRKP